MRLKGLLSFVQWTKESGVAWNKDNAPRLGAALSFYTVFSLAPLMIIATAIAGLVFGAEAVRGELSTQLQGLIGTDGAKAVEGLIAGAWKPKSNIIATLVGFITLLIGGTAVFSELRSVLNQIWKVPSKKITGIRALFKDKLLSFAMMAAVGFLLLVSLIANTILAAATDFLSGIFPVPGLFGQILYSFTSFLLITGLFASIFKVLPEKSILWKDVWVGSVITSALFSVGKFLMGLYLGRAVTVSAYGASASFVVIMLWAYYSSLIVIFGAEFTHVYSSHRQALPPSRPMELKRYRSSREH